MYKYLVIGIISLVFISCNTKKPTTKDIIGIWKSKSGASLNFDNKMNFEGHNLPFEHFIFSQDKEYDKFNGSGTWELQKKSSNHFSILLNFNKTDIKEKFSIQIFISGSNVMENAPPWYLFILKNNDIDTYERYKFFKQ